MIEPQRRSLQVVAHAGANPTAIDDPADANGGVEYIEGRDAWRARSVIRQWSPEHQLVGAFLYMSAEDARPILELVPDSAVWAPITRKAIEVIRSLVAEGRDPDPVVVLRAAEAQSTGELAHGLPSSGPAVDDSGSRHHQFVLYLADAYTQVIDPSSVHAYASEVLSDAYRRAFKSHGVRMQQLAETCVTREDEPAQQIRRRRRGRHLQFAHRKPEPPVLIQYFRVMQHELAGLSRRAQSATRTDEKTA